MSKFISIIFSHLLWLAAIASCIVLFNYQGSPYLQYANNYLKIYLVFNWLILVLSVLINIFFLALLNSDLKLKEGSIITEETFNRLEESIKKDSSFFTLTKRYLNYVFIVFVGVFLGKMGLFTAMLLNTVSAYFIRSQAKKLVDKVKEKIAQEIKLNE